MKLLSLEVNFPLVAISFNSLAFPYFGYILQIYVGVNSLVVVCRQDSFFKGLVTINFA